MAKAYRLLRQILQSAVEDRLIAENPCRLKGAATERTAERAIPSVEEVFILADAIDSRFRAMVMLAAFARLRRGECLGLTRRLELDSDPPTVTVEQSLVQTEGAGFVLQPPKTDAGVRTVAISGRLASEVRTHLATHAEDNPSAFIFSAEPPGQRSFRRAWELACERTRLDYTFHDLRHLAGTLNAAAGATLKESMSRMGHTSSVAALRYQHAVAERDGAIANAIESLIEASAPAEPST